MATASELGRGHLLDKVGLDNISNLIVTEAVDGQTTLVTLLHFAHIVLEATQTANLTLKDYDIIPDETGLRRPLDLTVDDVGGVWLPIRL